MFAKKGWLLALCCLLAWGVVGSAAFAAPASNAELIFREIPGAFTFSSGAGAWLTELYIGPNGAFSGYYSDWDMGDTGAGYPGGTHYECNFWGAFSGVRKVSENEYVMQLSALQTAAAADTEQIIDGVRVRYTTPYGLDDASEFRLYLPGRSTSDFSQELRYWTCKDDAWLNDWVLYNVGGDQGFLGYEQTAYVPPIAPVPTRAPSYGIGSVTIREVSKNGANVRAMPDQYAQMVGYVPMGTRYLCLSTASNGWREILLPTGVVGYVSGKLVDFSNDTSGRTYSSPIGTVTVQAERLRTYAAPSANSAFMGDIFRGISYPCVDRDVAGGWYCIAVHHDETGDWVVYVYDDGVTFNAG